MRQLSQIGTPDALKGACPVWGGLDGIPLPQGSMDAVLLLHAQYVPIPGSERMPMAEAHSVGPVAADERMEVTVRVRPRAALPTLAAAPHLGDQLPQQRRYMSREE